MKPTKIAESITNRGKQEYIPPAYRPIVQFSAEELSAIQENIQRWNSGDVKSAKEFTRDHVFAIYQTLGTIALKDVGGRSGMNARMQAARGFFDMAKDVLRLVEEIEQKDKPASKRKK